MVVENVKRSVMLYTLGIDVWMGISWWVCSSTTRQVSRVLHRRISTRGDLQSETAEAFLACLPRRGRGEARPEDELDEAAGEAGVGAAPARLCTGTYFPLEEEEAEEDTGVSTAAEGAWTRGMAIGLDISG